MKKYLSFLVSIIFVIGLVACGGGGSTSSQADVLVGNCKEFTSIFPGQSATMTENSKVLVPVGTNISVGGSTTVVDGKKNIVYTTSGAKVSVPSNATAGLTNFVTTCSGPTATLAVAVDKTSITLGAPVTVTVTMKNIGIESATNISYVLNWANGGRLVTNSYSFSSGCGASSFSVGSNAMTISGAFVNADSTCTWTGTLTPNSIGTIAMSLTDNVGISASGALPTVTVN